MKIILISIILLPFLLQFIGCLYEQARKYRKIETRGMDYNEK